MKINVLLFAQLKDAALGKDRLLLEVNEGTRIEELVEKLILEPPFSQCQKLPLIYALNENFVPGETLLNDQDVLALMTPVSGGAV